MTEAAFAPQTEQSNIEPIFTQLINYMDQGILVLDNSNSLLHANLPALKNLRINPAEQNNLSISIRSLIHDTNSMETAQHVVSINGREELIVGQLYSGQHQKLFLMSFYQPHLPEATFESNSAFEGVIGESERMRRLKTLITRIAPGPSSVLINGESGTGKEVIANTIHKLSNRAQNPFIAINCAAIPDQLLESELFGYTKGAFTGASSKGRVGLIQAANKGTLFLDEIGDMSLQLQAKLLRSTGKPRGDACWL